jgi:hypothetical protein
VSSAGTPLGGQAGTALNVLSLVGVAKVTSRKHVKLVFLLVHTAVGEPEEDTSREGDDGNGTVVPDKIGVGSQGSKGLSERSRESSGEALDGLDKRTHVLGCLGEGVLQGGDGCKDLRNGNENVDTGDSPDGNRRRVIWILSLVVTGRFVAGYVSLSHLRLEMLNLHVVLENGSPDHGE